MSTTPCAFLWGHMKESCEKAQATVPGDQSGNTSGGSGGIFSGPGSDWWRQAMFRIVEVVVGVAMVIAAVRGLVSSSPTVKVISQGVKAGAKKVSQS